MSRRHFLRIKLVRSKLRTSLVLQQHGPKYRPAEADTDSAVQGSTSAEVQAVRQAGADAAGATAYLNLETGDCHGDDTAWQALLAAGEIRSST